MEQLLQQAQDLVKTLKDKIASCNSKAKLQEAEDERQAKKANELEQAKLDISSREQAISSIENAKELLAQAKAQGQENSDQQSLLDGEKNKVATAKSDIAAQRQDIARDKELLQKDYDLLKKGQEQLAYDRQNYKEEVLKKLKNAGV
jgi:hypothetical protein